MNPDLVLYFPLSEDSRRRAITAMATGRARAIEIGRCRLHADLKRGHIRGTSALGRDSIAGDAGRDGPDLFERALDWAVRENERPPQE